VGSPFQRAIPHRGPARPSDSTSIQNIRVNDAVTSASAALERSAAPAPTSGRASRSHPRGRPDGPRLAHCMLRATPARSISERPRRGPGVAGVSCQPVAQHCVVSLADEHHEPRAKTFGEPNHPGAVNRAAVRRIEHDRPTAPNQVVVRLSRAAYVRSVISGL
jgi:hypothetical protein